MTIVFPNQSSREESRSASLLDVGSALLGHARLRLARSSACGLVKALVGSDPLARLAALASRPTLLALALCLAGTAHAQDANWYVGLPMAGVSLQAPDGSLPAADLEPLLRAKQGDVAEPRLLATDLVTLFRVGEFAAVEVDVEPWFIQTETGELAPAAMVTYLAWAAPVATQVRPQTTGAVKPRKIRQAALIDLGAPFYPDLDRPRVEARVTEWLSTQGYPEARVEVDAQDLGDGQTEVWIRVDEGPPRLVERVGFSAEGLWAERREHLLQASPDLTPQQLERREQQQQHHWDRRLSRWAAKAGVQEGQPVSPDALEAARFEIRRRLAALPPWWRRSSTYPDEGGWVQAVVHPAVVLPKPDGSQVITWTIEPDARLELEVSGVGWRGEAKATEALGIDERLRLTRGWVEEAPDKVESWMQERGYLQARADIALHRQEDQRVQTLEVHVDRGPRHALRRFGRRYTFAGADNLEHADLRTIMDQASPEVLKRGRVTPDEVDAAMRAVEEFYRANGFLEASVELDRLETRPYLIGAPPFRIPVPRSWEQDLLLRRNVRVYVDVVEGEQSLLTGFGIQGAAEEVDLSTLEARGQGMLDQPFSPQALERLARGAVEAHRQAGFLLADARVSNLRLEDGSYTSAIAVSPGPQVLLRSVTVRGARRTRTRLVRGEIDPHLVLGQPLTTLDLDLSRRALYETGAFRSVHTDLLGEQDAGDLLVSVVERPRYSLQSGLGLATDQGFRGYARGTRNNWLGLAHRGELFVQLGFEWRSDIWYDLMPEWTQPEWRAAFTYTAPRFPTRSQDLAVDLLFRELEQERTWRLARSGVGLSLQSTLPTDTVVRMAARLEGRQLEEIDPGVLVGGEPWLALMDKTDPELPSPWRLQETLSVQIMQDLRDNPLQPRRGAVISLLGDYGPGITGASEARVPFVKAEARMSAWIPLGRSTSPILHLAGSGGRAWMPQGGVLALEDRYRLGGTASLRGFRRDSVGPRNLVSQLDADWPDALGPLIDHVLRDDPERWVSTGGDARVAATVELLLPLPWLGLRDWEGWGASLFADVGDVWLLSKGASASSQLPRYADAYAFPLRTSAGAGIRVETPVGPLQIDLAANLESLMATGERRTLIREDWEEPPLRAHLSLGTLW